MLLDHHSLPIVVTQVTRKRDVVVFNSPEASYQYDTGFPSQSSSSRLTIKPEGDEEEEEEAEPPAASEQIKKASDALTENRIRITGDLYTYKVREERPATTFIRQKKTPVKSTTVIKKAPSPSASSKKPLPKYGATFVTRSSKSPSSSSKQVIIQPVKTVRKPSRLAPLVVKPAAPRLTPVQRFPR